MTNFTKIALSIAAIASLNACGGGSSTPTTTTTDTTTTPTTTTPTCTTPSTTVLAGDLTGCTLLTADKTWELDGLVVVTSGAELQIEAGTTVRGHDGTGDATSYLIVDKGAKIMAEGTVDKPIVFTSLADTQAVGLWGGVTIIGNAANAQVQPYEVNSAFVAGATDMADNSGVLKYVKILNSGITMEQDKEINGLSLVGVGSGTIIDNITIDYSDDDGIEAWGGTVNMSNITVSNCTDDHFDIDDGFSGKVTNLKITQTSGNAAMEMSGTTAATFDGLTIVQNTSAKEGVVFFKGAGIGGHFKNAMITDNVTSATVAGALHSNDVVAIDTVSFENVTLNGTSTEYITGASAAALTTKFNSGVNNTPDL
ncbi:MAG TPA: hypothetical protein PLH07_03360 [Sulfurovum sp.]|jgi:hypothetical protein|nr:MAG: hypothetical protein B7Y52_02970 [Sulfurovum sp. 28-43-6]OYZ49224.1 MAG: hypothetical protein B7Y13_05245 [Sulfurovum sp. 24-42-9]OZA42831.1 MAG: hypothetical protein B7X80_09955 [Sulfurovum sp. 17-42-90]OZA61511.1 MAG: hypothetical protein B7X69_00230 [Sulfurovum sp. 39-42-12]HQR72986.1 hypothetical protein [Sulfurovum sp.]